MKIYFARERAIVTELEALVAAERQCCGFVDWALDDHEDLIAVTITGSEDGVTAMAEAFRI
jgi:hypothetical protein